MEVVYYQDRFGNFGDDLNRWLWPRHFGGVISRFKAHNQLNVEGRIDEPLFYGIGTILDQRIPIDIKKIIFGSGAGYFKVPTLNKNCEICFVRGPLTADKLGLDNNAAITDPAILLSRHIKHQTNRDGIGFVPHHNSIDTDNWGMLCNELGIRYITPQGNDPIVPVHAIAKCEVLITESLHGAIIADAFRIPWVAVSTLPHINTFKWIDWCKSVGLEYVPVNLIGFYAAPKARVDKHMINQIKKKVVMYQMKKLMRKMKPVLSSNTLLDIHLEQIEMHIDNLLGRLRSTR